MTILQDILAAANWQTRVTENFRSVSPAGLYGINPATTTGLTLGYLGGEFNGVTVANGTVLLTASATNYVVAHRTTGAVTVSTSTTNWLNTGTYMQLYQFVASTSTFTIATTSDKRQAFGGSGGGGGTPGGANTQIQYNSSGAFAGDSGLTYTVGTQTLTGVNLTATGLVLTAASATGGAGFRVPHGAAPTSPTNGDVWTTTAGVFARINGATVGPLGAGGSFTGGTLTSAINEAPQVTLASAATVNIGAAAANSISVSGTTTITAFDTIASGAVRRLVFQGVLTFTHNATTLILPGAASITTAAGDVAWMESLGAGNWRCVGYHKASGQPVAGGGAGLTNFTESVNTSTPNTTVPVARLIAANAATDVDIALTPKGVGALTAQIADNGTAGGIKRGSNAVDWQTIRTNSNNVASGIGSVVSGGGDNKAAGLYTAIGGGNVNFATASYAAVSGGYTNTASGQYSFIGGGSTNTASNTYAAVIGGTSNTASTQQSAVLGGTTNTASAVNATVVGGSDCTSDGSRSFVAGSSYATARGLTSVHAHASGRFSALGDAQSSRFVFRRQTTDATVSGVAADGNAPAATTSVVLPNTSAYTFVARVVARNNANGDCASWEVKGSCKRGAAAANTAIVGTPTVTSLGADSGASAWVVAAVANTTLGSLEIQVTGVAATTIKWVASVWTTEVVG